MKELTDLLTPNEKAFATKAGQTYLKVIKAMGIFLLLGLLLTGAALVTSQPDGAAYELDSGDSIHTARFFGEAGDVAQFGFGITHEDGKEYQYTTGQYYDDDTGTYYSEHIEDPWDLMVFMDNMDWKVQMQVQYSESISFDSFEVVEDVSGEINFVSFELYKDGFYRIEVTNLSESTLTIAVGKAEANYGLIAAALVSWIAFSLTVAVFTFMVHLGVWAVCIFLLLKAFTVIQEDNQKKEAQVIEPQTQRQV